MVAPHGTSPAIVQKINQDLRRALESPDLVAKFREMGNYTKPMSPRQLIDYIAMQHKQWGAIVQKVATESQ